MQRRGSQRHRAGFPGLRAARDVDEAAARRAELMDSWRAYIGASGKQLSTSSAGSSRNGSSAAPAPSQGRWLARPRDVSSEEEAVMVELASAFGR